MIFLSQIFGQGLASQKRCHHCHSKRFVKHGHRNNTKADPKQRYLCKECGRTFSESGFGDKHHRPREITRALHGVAAGLSSREASYAMKRDHIKVDPSIHRWMAEYPGLVNRFSRTLRPRLGHRWHCDEVFFKILGLERWLFTVMDGRTRFILSWDISDPKTWGSVHNRLSPRAHCGSAGIEANYTDEPAR